MSLEDSFAKHGVTAAAINFEIVAQAYVRAMKLFEHNGQRHVTMLALAGVIVQAQAELSGDTVDNTIELMRRFMDAFADLRAGKKPVEG